MTALACRLVGHDFPEFKVDLNGVSAPVVGVSVFGPCSRCGAIRQPTHEELEQRVARLDTSLSVARDSLRHWIALDQDNLPVLRAAEDLGEAPKGTRRVRAEQLAKAVADFHEAHPDRLLTRQVEIAGRELADGLRAGLESGRKRASK